MFKTKNDLPEAMRVKVIEILNARLADCIDLQTQTKQAHWNVKGPHFIGLHELFDQINEAVEDYVDGIAERAVQLGGVAEGTARAVAKRSSLPEYPAKAMDGHPGHVERCRPPWRRSARRRGRRSTRPTNWATWTRPTCSRRCRAASTSGCGSSRRTCRRSADRDGRLSRAWASGHDPERRRLTAPPSRFPLPGLSSCLKYVAGIRIPDSKLAREATDLLREHGGPLLLAHSLRVYLFGAIRGRQQGWVVDHELFYVEWRCSTTWA